MQNKNSKNQPQKTSGDLFDDTDELWEKLPTEGSRQYSQFCAYRDMAYLGGRFVNKRSLRKLAKQLNLKSSKPLELLSVKFSWQGRCDAYDLYIEKKTREEHETAIIKMRKDHADVAAQIVKKATKRLLTIPDDEISPADLVRLFDIGVKIERLSRGDSTENTRISGEAKISHEGTVKIERGVDLSKLSDKELTEFEQLLEKLN